MIRRGLTLLCILLACVVPVFALGKTAASGTKPRPTATAQDAGGILRLTMSGTSPSAVDPAMVADEQGVQIAGLMYSGLVRLDDHYRVVSDAATWSVGRDHRTYEFHIRRGQRFSNGDPLTASDFQYSITRSLNPSLKSPSAPTYLLDIAGASAVLAGKSKRVAGIKVINSYTLQITARWPVPYFLMELSYPTSYALDARRLSRDGSIDSTNWYSNPVGSGPYRLKAWVPNTSMVFVPNKYFAGAKPALRRIDVSLSPPTGGDMYSYVRRSSDVASLCWKDSKVRTRAGMQDVNMLAVNGLYMNLKDRPFKNPHMRLALTLALDRTTLIHRAMGQSATPFASSVPLGESGYDPGVRLVPHNEVQARRQLALSGHPDGKGINPLTLYYGDDGCSPGVGKLAAAVAKAWHKVLNLDVSAQALTEITLLAKVQAGSLPLYMAGWSADYPDPHDWLSLQWESYALNNNVHYSSTRFDALVQRADVTWDYGKRMALDNEAQQVLVNDAAWIPLYIPHRLVFLSPAVSNLSITGYGIMPRWGNWAGVQVRRVQASTKRHRGLE